MLILYRFVSKLKASRVLYDTPNILYNSHLTYVVYNLQTIVRFLAANQLLFLKAINHNSAFYKALSFYQTCF
jgi:hypothetical protein